MSTEKKNPWTDPDPQPGDFDADIADMGPEDVQHVEAGSGVKVVVIDTDDVDGWLRRRRDSTSKLGLSGKALE